MSNYFLVRIEVHLSQVPVDDRDTLLAAESQISTRLRDDGLIKNMWRVPGKTASVSIWEATDATELHDGISQLPLFPWADVSVEPLARHYLTIGNAPK